MNSDKNIQIIRKVILKYLPDSTIQLYGSRAGNEYDDASDYDIMVITSRKLDQTQISDYKSFIRKDLAGHLIPIDLIIITNDQLPLISTLTNHIVNEALSTGFAI